MPAWVSPDEIKHGRETINQLAAKAGRDPASIQILVFGTPGQFRDREAIKDLEEAGADRVTIWLDSTDGDQAVAELDEIARKVLI